MVRGMTFRHVLVSLSIACLCACSSDDTIVSLNVNASDRVPAVEHLQVTFKQGSHSYAYEFAPPTDTSGDGVKSIKNGFFQRITLPGDWDEADAMVSVEAFQANGAAFTPPLVDETQITIVPEGTVAAYVKLDIPEPPPMGAAGDGAGGAASEGGAPATEGGAPPSEGGAPENGGAPGVGGAAAGAGGAD
jgi:hypothetical protein